VTTPKATASPASRFGCNQDVTMSQAVPSNFSPFAYEPMRRGAESRGAPEAVGTDRELGMRLMRGPGNPRDRALSPLAQQWMEGLPSDLQPHTMAHTYARIVNRLALCWADPALREMLFADLLGSRRQGRRGFPTAVHTELTALREFAGLGPKPVAAPPRRVI